MTKVVLIGDEIGDYYFTVHRRYDGHLPYEKDGVPVYQSKLVSTQPGGAAAVCRMMKKLGVDVTPYFGGVSYKTWYSFPDGTRCRIDSDDTRSSYSDVSLDGDEDFLVFSDYGKTAQRPNILNTAKEQADKIVIVVDPYRGTTPTKYAGADIVVPNDDAFYAYSDAWLQSFDFVIHKQGAKGATIYRQGLLMSHVPPMSVHAVDECGAGDQFLAALVASLDISNGIDPQNLVDAVYTANTAAALNCTKLGTTPVTWDEIKAKQPRK